MALEEMRMEIIKRASHRIAIKGKDGGSIEAQSVEANLLFEILKALWRIEKALKGERQ